MTTHRTTSAYSKAFQVFLKHTDEKVTLFYAILKKLRQIKPLSLLKL